MDAKREMGGQVGVPHEMKILTGHVQAQFAFVIFANFNPTVLPLFHLFEVDNVVSCRTIAIVIEMEAIAAETDEVYLSQIFEQIGTFCWSHRIAQSRHTTTQILVHVTAKMQTGGGEMNGIFVRCRCCADECIT